MSEEMKDNRELNEALKVEIPEDLENEILNNEIWMQNLEIYCFNCGVLGVWENKTWEEQAKEGKKSASLAKIALLYGKQYLCDVCGAHFYIRAPFVAGKDREEAEKLLSGRVAKGESLRVLGLRFDSVQKRLDYLRIASEKAEWEALIKNASENPEKAEMINEIKNRSERTDFCLP